MTSYMINYVMIRFYDIISIFFLDISSDKYVGI